MGPEDFDPDEIDDRDEHEHDNSGGSKRSLKDRYDSGKENYDKFKNNVDKAKEFRNSRRNANTAKNAGQEATKAAGKEAGKTAAKEAGKTAAKEAGKEVAKQAAKTAAKEGAKMGVRAAADGATAGAAEAVFIAKDIADKLNEKFIKPIKEKVGTQFKEATGVDSKTAKRAIILAIILLPFMLFVPFFAASAMFLASEDTYTDLSAIIQKREKRYAESGKPTKPLLLMTNDEINEILTKDYGEEDYCYKTYLKDKYNKDYDNFIPSDSNDPTSTYAEKVAIIEKYLKAGRDNFNRINWKIVGGNGSVEVKEYKLKGKDSVFTDPGSLKMPNINKYRPSQGMTEEQIENMYISMVNSHLQHWVIPYALNIASQDNEFGKTVLNDMWHKIDITLYELDRLTKNTLEKYYIKTSVTETVTTYYPPAFEGDTGSSSSSSSTFESDTSHTWTNYSVGNTSYSYSVTKIQGSDGGYIAVGGPYNTSISKDQKPFRHVPKLTYTEDLYNIITASFSIIPINESNPPAEKSESLIDADGKKTIIEIWDEDLQSVDQKTEKYKVSYMKAEAYADLGRDISRVEWYLDFGGGSNATYPEKTQAQKDAIKNTYLSTDNGVTPPLKQGYSYNDLIYGFQQIEKFYKALAETAGGGLGYNVIDIGDIPQDGFAWPVDLNQSPNSAWIGYLFGYTEAYGREHSGIDIRHGGTITQQGGLTIGPNIIAAHDGTVTEAKLLYSVDSTGTGGNQSGYGNVVKIQTEDGKFMTVYGHLSSVAVTQGQKVTRGQVIGTMGTTGNSSGTHLHYEIRLNGIIMDPLMYYKTEPTYGSYQPREGTPPGYYKYVGSISSGLNNSAATGGMMAFIIKVEGAGEKSGNNYVAYDDGVGYITIGPGVTWKDHVAEFQSKGIMSMSVGTLVPIPIVDEIAAQEVQSRLSSIRSLLASKGITDIKEYQLVALLSYSYNVGNINKFPAAYLANGATEGLWGAFWCRPITAKGKVLEGLEKRREAEFELFMTGNYNVKVYDRTLTRY